MKIKEFIDVLSKYPGDMDVVTALADDFNTILVNSDFKSKLCIGTWKEYMTANWNHAMKKILSGKHVSMDEFDVKDMYGYDYDNTLVINPYVKERRSK